MRQSPEPTANLLKPFRLPETVLLPRALASIVKFVSGQPAAVVADYLVVADLHLGFEFELQRRGVRIAPSPAALAAELRGLMRKARCKRLVVMGDFKHDVRGFEARERRVVQEFVAAFAAPVLVVKGNHDSRLEGVEGLQVAPVGGVVLREGKVSFGLHHGHAWPSPELFQAGTLLAGNNHPAVEFSDSLGFKWLRKAWVLGKVRVNRGNRRVAAERGCRDGQPVVVFPAFSQLYSGTAFNRVDSLELLGPLFQNSLFDLDGAVAVGLDGVRLGVIRNLRSIPPRTRARSGRF